MTQQSNFLTKALQAVAVLLIAAIFVGLGVWQLQRAADLKSSLKVATTIDANVVPLESVTQPREAIPAQALNRTVSATGHYIANFRAPNQVDGDGKQSDWEVALLQIGTNSAILVVRGLWSERLLNPDIQVSGLRLIWCLSLLGFKRLHYMHPTCLLYTSDAADD